MNPFFNPIFVFRILQSYLIDINRLQRLDNKSLRQYQNRQLRKMVEYANTVPMYQNKFKKADIRPIDIQSVDDITKLPLTSKKDIIKNYPNNIVPSDSYKRKAIQSYTSGTTGEPLSIYVDVYTIVKALLGFIRTFNVHNVDWRKTRMTIIADLSEDSIEREYLTDGILPDLKPFFSFDNMQFFNTYDDPKIIIKKINKFQPEFISSYPGMLRQLAFLRRQGIGKDICPRSIITSGTILDSYLKQYIEESFETKIFDMYGAMESGPMAFQCRFGKYHIHSDLVILEFIDEDGNSVCPGEPGHIVVTKLYGKGTPIIRYTGLNDIITPTNETCSCGIAGGLISKIHGREIHSIILPNNSIILPYTIDEFIGDLYFNYDIDNIERFQIIQHTKNKIEILAVLNKDMKNIGIPKDKAFLIIKNKFIEKFGTNIKVNVREVDLIKPHTPGVVSKVDRSGIKKKKYV